LFERRFSVVVVVVIFRLKLVVWSILLKVKRINWPVIVENLPLNMNKSTDEFQW